MQNTNLIYALAEESGNVGAIRETFVLNQLSVNHVMTYSESGDFLLNGKYTLEVGGKSKSFNQIKGMENAYLVKDDIEFGAKGIIPIWMFGLLY